MNDVTNDRTDVVVVGAGPVGLLLAAEVTLGGGRVVVLERLSEPSALIKAGSINLASAELLARRGLLAALMAASGDTLERVSRGASSNPSEAGRQRAARGGRAGHFAGIWLPADLVDDDDPALRGHAEAAGATMVPQQQIEALLAEHAAALGVEVRRGVAVTGVRSGEDGVVVDTDAGPIAAGWVVGCDGGRSLVRHAAHFDFPGSAPEITGHQAIVDLADDSGLERGWNWSTHGVYCYGPIPGRVLTVEFDGPPADRDAPVTAEQLQRSLRRTSGVDVTITGVHGQITRWTDNTRQAATYRSGRVLLAGDAAHVHPPFSGQGLNLGLGDAMNLGWKLAAVVTGRAEQRLLDTYTAERHPAGEWVMDWTRAQVALMRPDEKNRPLRDTVSALMNTRDGATKMSARISGVARRIPLDGEHSWVGRTVPDVSLTGGSMLREAFTDGRFVLLDAFDQAAEVTATADRVVVVSDPAQPTALLARPDGVVVWAADEPGRPGPAPDLQVWASPRAAVPVR